MAEEADGAEGGGESAPKTPRDKQLLLILANTVLVLAALGTLVYTKLLYKRPAIVESTELQKVQEEIKAPPTPAERVYVKFDQLVVNIAMTSGKAHYATVAMAVECRDADVGEKVNEKKAILVDTLIASLAKRQMTELNTIQGKLLLKADLLRQYNALIDNGAITDIFFDTFILQ